MKNQAKTIECEGVQIAAFIDAYAPNHEHPVYSPSSILFYTKQGQLNISVDQKKYSIPRDHFGLVRKFISGMYSKSWTEEEGFARTYAFVLQNDFIKEIINDFEITTKVTAPKDPIFLLPKNKILKGLFESITSYIDEKEDIDKALVKVKTREALMGILNYHPEYISIFTDFATPQRANLIDFMSHNYMSNVSLKNLAKMSGRSLSTFHREFKSIFNQSPHQWILKKRLERAKEILLTTNRKPIEFYMELGFEDLAHFSRTFKKEFGKTLTEVRAETKL